MFSNTAGSKHSDILYIGNEHEVLFLAIENCIQEYTVYLPLTVNYKYIFRPPSATFINFDN